MRRRRKRKEKNSRGLILSLLSGAILGLVVGYSISFINVLPKIKLLEDYSPLQMSELYDDEGRLITGLYKEERRVLVNLATLPKHLINALIATEDRNFYKHHGLDLRGILRALFRNIAAGRVCEGGSTLTQQLARQLFLTREKTLIRKIKESILALQIEARYTKDEILEIYLNQAFFGQGCYGIEKAAREFFGKNAREVTVPESAFLVGLLKAPSYYSNPENLPQALQRKAVVLKLMYEQGYLTSEEYAASKKVPLSPKAKKWERKDYFTEYIQNYLESKYGPNLVYKGGLKVYTTLNLRLQELAQEAIRWGIDRVSQMMPQEEKTQGSEEPLQLQGSLIALSPRGEIKAMVGGYDFYQSPFNRAVYGKRQAGSAFKIFTYTAALDNGFTPATFISDAPISFKMADGTLWEPKNYGEDILYGLLPLRKALALSINTCAVRLIDHLGPQKVVEYAYKMGIRKSKLLPYLSLTLGACEVSNLELTSAYATLANYGTYTAPIWIKKVVDKEGRVLEETIPYEEKVLDEATAYLMISLLQSAVEEGTCKIAKQLYRPVACKTGTTNEFTDAWFLGFTPQLVCGVWVGYDIKKSLGERMSGAVVAGPIWVRFMKRALAEEEIEDFPVPPGVSFIEIDKRTGSLPTGKTRERILEVFKKGSEPQEIREFGEE